MTLLDGVRRAIQRYQLAGPSTRVAVAVSGGPDSVALLHLLLHLRDAGDLQLAGVLHFNHQLRSDADERFVAGLAEEASLPFRSDRSDVRQLAREHRRSLEDAARTARHTFFASGAAALSADAVAVGHTRNDQAETFLLRLLRGAGARGLSGMHPRSGLIVRPLLDARREEIYEYLSSRHLAFRVDDTNSDRSIPRNRVRHELLPLLANQYNPRIVDLLADEATLLQAQHAHLSSDADAWLRRYARRDARRVTLELRPLLDAPRAVGYAVLHQAMSEAGGSPSVSFGDVERAFDVVEGRRPACDAPRVRLERIAGRIVLTGRPEGHRGRWQPGKTNLFQYPLSIPGEVTVAETGASVSAELAPRWAGPSTPDVATVQVPGSTGTFVVRNRRPGDRFQPLGSDGRKKLHDFFIDRKVARAERDDVPLVVDSTDRIVWVAGHTIEEAFRVKDSAQSVIILRLKGVGGSV